MWCVVVCDLENLVNEEATTPIGSQRHKNIYIIIIRKNLANPALRNFRLFNRQQWVFCVPNFFTKGTVKLGK